MSDLLTLAVIGIGAAAAWRFLKSLGKAPPISRGEQEALRLLDEQYRRGEIDQREYERRRQALFRR